MKRRYKLTDKNILKAIKKFNKAPKAECYDLETHQFYYVAKR